MMPKSKVVQILELAKGLCDFCLDQHGNPFAWLKEPGKVMMLRSREFKNFLAREYYSDCGKACSPEVYQAVVGILEAETFDAPRYDLHVRMFFDERNRRILIDSGHEDYRVIEVSQAGVSRIAAPYPIFRRYNHSRPLFDGASGGSPEDLKALIRFFNLKDSADEVLLCGYIGAAFVANIPHAVLILHGSQGSTKTTLSSTLRKLIDNSSLLTLSLADRPNELAQQLSHHYFLPIDNVSKVRPWQVDMLCRTVTGEGFSKRQLYTDEDDVIFSFKLVLTMNGVNIAVHRGDILDRSLPIELARVPKSQRKEESAVSATLEEALPRAFNATLEALSKAIGLVDVVRGELKELARMADFAVWGEAFCRALGYPLLQFYNRYMERIAETSSVVIENDAVAELVLMLMRDPRYQQYHVAPGVYEGTASELRRVLQDINSEVKFVDEKDLPRQPRTLSNWLGDISANLADEGCKVIRTRAPDRKRTRLIRISSDGVQSKLSSAASGTSAHSLSTGTDVVDERVDAKDSSIGLVRPIPEVDAGRSGRLVVCSCGGGPYRGPEDRVWKGHKRLLRDELGHELREAEKVT